MPEVKGTIKVFSKSNKGFILNEYDDQWFNRGKGLEGAWPTQRGDAVTVTFESSFDADGVEKFWVLEIWPTSTGKPAAGPKPTSGPVPTNGPGPTPAPTGPVPTPPNRENSILFQVCLKAAQDFVLNAEGWSKTPANVLSVADLYYEQGARLISGEGLSAALEADGDPGPTEEPQA